MDGVGAFALFFGTIFFWGALFLATPAWRLRLCLVACFVTLTGAAAYQTTAKGGWTDVSPIVFVLSVPSAVVFLLVNRWNAGAPAREKRRVANRALREQIKAGLQTPTAKPTAIGIAPIFHPSRAVAAPRLVIRYTDSKGHVSDRTIQPLQIAYGHDGFSERPDRLEARCITSGGTHRSFILMRIRTAAEATTGEVIADLPAWLEQRAG